MSDSLVSSDGKPPANGPGGGSKRALDLFLSIVLLALLSPMILIVWALVVANFGRPALVSRDVVGLRGRVFRQYRFRISPNQAASKRKNSDPGLHDWLRASGVEDLPGLYNVLKGDMSMVGPCPRTQRELTLCGPAASDLLLARPGLVSPSRHLATGRLPARKAAALDQHYVQAGRIADDFRLLARALTSSPDP
ncbi:sugar transferase [Alsobacter sp. SYSU M60028]|uniref:Sugar transferase n=1 Tax=Alsobacter ponti TaxID=2962936 RepID=A0ABT1LAF1_9HYPH|nr:sugar transferase [Alsobacter ponti]